ncbi:MAG TPA: hypothetical protein VGG74_15985 [Kofleriaceae bacterium]|jgi:hypothetical protein
MRFLGAVLAGTLVMGCSTTTYQIPHAELMRLSQLPPQQRGDSVRVVQQLTDADLGPAQPVTAETQVVLFPQIFVVGGNRPRERAWGPGANWNGNFGGGGVHGGVSGGGGGAHGGGGHGGGGNWNLGNDGKATAIVALVVAAVAVVVVGAIEGSRYDGFVKLHPMHPLYLTGLDGSQVMMPLAALDPQSAAFTDRALIRSSDGPWRTLGRAPLDRQGFTYALMFGTGSFASADGSKKLGTASTIQLGYYITQQIGIVGSVYFGWRDNSEQQTLFESRYTLELQGYPVVVGPLHLGLYGGGGGAYRFEDGVPDGDSGGWAVMGGALGQLDINTRLAITARLGQTYAHDERMTDVLFGISVY